MAFPFPKASVHRLGVVPEARVVVLALDLVVGHDRQHLRLPLEMHLPSLQRDQHGHKVDQVQERARIPTLVRHPHLPRVNAPPRALRAALAADSVDAVDLLPAFSLAAVVLAAADLAVAKAGKPVVGASPFSILLS
jgi:hypothetical protein